jgi:hypothetical protein
MSTVWKYELYIDDYIIVSLPRGAKPLTVQSQKEKVYLWCLVNPHENNLEERIFRLAGTGHPIVDNNLFYIGTFQLYDGSFVGHLFEVKKN